MDDLRRRARRAYERGRVRAALPATAAVLPFVVLGPGLAHAVPLALFGLALALGVGWLHWRGGAAGRAVWPGLWAGALAFSGPRVGAAVSMVEADCGLTPACVACCSLGGVAAGVLLATWRRTAPAELVWALSICSGVTALACLPLGGAALAVAVGSAAGVSGSREVVRLARVRS